MCTVSSSTSAQHQLAAVAVLGLPSVDTTAVAHHVLFEGSTGSTWPIMYCFLKV